MFIFLFLTFLFFILAILFRYLSSTAVYRDNRNYISLHSIISSQHKEDKVAYTYISGVPSFMFEENGISYYFVTDDTFIYIASIDQDTYDILSEIDYAKNRVKIVGISKGTTYSIAENTLSYFNAPFFENTEDILSMDDFKDYYGLYYLDLVDYGSNTVMIDSDLEGRYRKWYLIFGGLGILLIFLAEYSRRKSEEDI